jgi:ubiquinone/menaquinone biosynthesis C-methylase UbiE
MSFAEIFKKVSKEKISKRGKENEVDTDTSRTFLRHCDQEDNRQRETVYFSPSGVCLPIQAKFRYSVKPGWLYFGPLSALNDLHSIGLLKPDDHQFLKQAVGHRTLRVSLEKCRTVLEPYLQRYPEQFLTTVIPDLGKRLLTPRISTVQAEIQALTKSHRKKFKQLSELGLFKSTLSPYRVLEVGYSSGGTSAIAFERCGCNVHAIDYFFDSAVEATPRHEVIKVMTGSSVKFHRGDITRETPFGPGQFDMVYSSSTIEHINHLEAAFREMYRILKPGGLSVHRYDPYFHPAGGHSLGILDSPWAHVRLPLKEIPDYIRTYRPYEANVAIPWIQKALHQNYTQSFVQQALVKAGFEICLWETTPVARSAMNDLTYDVMIDCFETVPGLNLEDLLTRSIYFVARKIAEF